MKKLFFINDTVENKISYYHLVCILVTLPFDFFYSKLIFISFALHTLIHAQKVKNIFTKEVLVLISIYLLGVIGVLYSQDKDEAFSIVMRQWSVLIIPIVFSISNFNIEKYKLNLVCIFGFACTAGILYLYADALLTTYHFHLPLSSLLSLAFMNHNFSMPVKIHATYLSIYTAFSIIYFLYVLFNNSSGKIKWLYIFCTIILSAGLIQLSSKSVFIAVLIIVNLFFPFFLFNGRRRLLFFLTACFVSVTVLVMIANVDSFKTRYISELKTDLTDNVKIIENTEPRLARWEAILELAKRHPLAGYGTGAERKELKEVYFTKGLYISYLNEFNAHSQYLSILIRLGIIGLALYMYILYFGFATAFKKKDILFLGFMVVITTVSISENFLDMDRGVFFYSFFFSLFLIKESKKVTKPNKVVA
ncbi:MAG: O-antigen ligase family protein [Ferruginibacter sp.]